jgi:hypothetical protein
MSQGKDNHADLGNADTSTPQPSPHRKNIEENERNETKRAEGKAGEGFEDAGDEYAHSDGAGYREADAPGAARKPAQPPARSTKS